MWLSREAGGEAEGEEERQRSTEASRSGSRTSGSSGARALLGSAAHFCKVVVQVAHGDGGEPWTERKECSSRPGAMADSGKAAAAAFPPLSQAPVLVVGTYERTLCGYTASRPQMGHRTTFLSPWIWSRRRNPVSCGVQIHSQKHVVFRPGDNPGANRWFLQSTPIQMPPPGGGICGIMT